MTVAETSATSISTESGDEETFEEIEDYGKLRELLSKSSTMDAYCRSVLYFALTGRRRVWTVKYGDKYLVLLLHPNVTGILLVFFPFVSNADELTDQLRALFQCRNFRKRFSNHEIFLARIPELIAEGLFLERGLTSVHYDLQRVDETILDWVYPSYDVDLQKLLSPRGGRLKTYRKKLRKFCDRDIELLRPRRLTLRELSKIVRQISISWLRTKRESRNSYQILGIPPRDLIGCYRAMARLNSDTSFATDGLILKRGGAYVAFSFWERPANGETVPCLAALPASHEKGLSEYLYHRIAKCLKDDGYHQMCIGGSETKSLDQFKKKLDPSKAHKLQTIRISLPSSQLSA